MENYTEKKLTIELVPSTAWYTNVRSNTTQAEWDIIRKKSYKKAGSKCEICGDVGQNQGVRHSVECHEIWEYDDTEYRQVLVGLVSLCPHCHKVKHPGLAQMKGEGEIVLAQLMKVNEITREEASDYLSESFATWRERSKHEWELDISYIEKFLKDEEE